MNSKGYGSSTPTTIKHFFARWIDLKEGTFHEEEVNEHFLQTAESWGYIQVLDKEHIRTVEMY